jgi:hypothetical protein
MISLSQALRTNSLEEFIHQQEAAGIGPIEKVAFLGAVSKVIKREQRSDQTSRSASRGGWTEK